MIEDYLKDFFGGRCYIVEVKSWEELKDILGLNDYDPENHYADNPCKPGPGAIPSGRTTRAADDIIQVLFDEGVCIVPIRHIGKFMNIENEELKDILVVDTSIEKEGGIRELLDKVASRLEYEHKRSIRYKVSDDFIRIFLEDESND